MKKLWICFSILIVLGIVMAAIAIMKPTISRTCRIGEYNITMKIPYAYEKEEDNYEDSLMNLYNKEQGIRINAIELKENFWSSDDIESRMEEYLKVITSVNYEAGLKNLKTEIIEGTSGRIGKIEFELSKNYEEEKDINLDESKAVTLITNAEIGNVVIEILASKENFDKNKEEIEHIVRSIQIKE